MAVYGSCIYIFGGYGYGKYSNELYQFEVGMLNLLIFELISHFMLQINANGPNLKSKPVPLQEDTHS